MFKQLCKQHYPILFRQPIFTSKTYNHAVTYNSTSADDNLINFSISCRYTIDRRSPENLHRLNIDLKDFNLSLS